jgi:hypothetical protein
MDLEIRRMKYWKNLPSPSADIDPTHLCPIQTCQCSGIFLKIAFPISTSLTKNCCIPKLGLGFILDDLTRQDCYRREEGLLFMSCFRMTITVLHLALRSEERGLICYRKPENVRTL